MTNEFAVIKSTKTQSSIAVGGSSRALLASDATEVAIQVRVFFVSFLFPVYSFFAREMVFYTLSTRRRSYFCPAHSFQTHSGKMAQLAGFFTIYSVLMYSL